MMVVERVEGSVIVFDSNNKKRALVLGIAITATTAIAMACAQAIVIV